ncbi:MAG TPA: hypothetical protein VEX68_29515 [Bryobacteraceae bacterium]|nr:hypothetical protein [Bryobacteraceae bacterium]
MTKLKGTRVYWRPSVSGSTAPRQILKNSGYISIVLHAVQYKATGNFWQDIFGGSDKVTISTQVTWQSGSDPKIAAAIQDFRKVSSPSVNPLAIGRNIVLKVPAVADGIETQVAVTALRDDNLGKTLQILNSDEFKQPLQLAPVALGQALTIANIVKKVFTDADPSDALKATYPGIISESEVADPVANNRLVEGYIVIIVKQDDEDQLDFDTSKMTISGNGLLVNGTPVRNTYVIYNVTFDKWKGRDQNSAWSKKFDQASSKADELIFAAPAQHAAIIAAAYDLLKEASALLDEDVTYTKAERNNLKKAAMQEVKDKIDANKDSQENPQVRSVDFSVTGEVIRIHPEPIEENFRPEVTAYAEELAAKGLPFGFSFRPNE